MTIKLIDAIPYGSMILNGSIKGNVQCLTIWTCGAIHRALLTQSQKHADVK